MSPQQIVAKEEGGVVHHYREDGEYLGTSCARCGSSAESLPCGNCDDGIIEDDTDPLWGVEVHECDWCMGRGGSWHCISSPEWCEANPLPGKEGIESTALNSQAWRDSL